MLISSLEEQHVLRRNTGGICSSSPETLSHWWPSAVTLSYQHRHIRSLLHLHWGYCARVFSVLIRLCCVASVWMNSSSPQGHQSWVHPLSCSALCHPPCTPWELHFISASLPEPFVFHLCRNKICIQEQECSWWVFEKGGRQTEKLKNGVI